MIKKVLHTISKHGMIGNGERVLVCVSGGADSVALLHVLLRLRNFYNINVFAAHMNHCLRGDEANEDENFVRELCNSKDVELFIERHDVQDYAKHFKKTIEEAGRILRYEMFYRILTKHSLNKIALGHNLNDNAETIIMKLCRGTVINTGIHPKRQKIIRPLINITRHEIETYCLENDIDYRTDSSNLSNEYTRNKIRHMLPILQSLNPNLMTTLTSNSLMSYDEDLYMNEIAGDELVKLKKDNVLYAKPFDALHIALKRRVMLLMCREYSNNISSKHVESVISLHRSGSMICLPDGLTVKRTYDKFVFNKPFLGG